MKLMPMVPALVLAALPVLVSAERHAIDVDRSRVTVRVFKSGVFSVFADDHVITAPIAGGYLEDEPTLGIEIHFIPRQMRVTDTGLSPENRETVQTRMLGSEVLDADRFPDVWFRSTAVEVIDRGRWLVRGNLTLHGQTRSVAVVAIYENGNYRGSATLRQRDFGITPISIAGGAVKVKDELRIEFDISLVE